MFVKKLRFFEESITTKTPEALEEKINIICMNDMIVKSQLFDCFIKSSNSSSARLKIVYKDVPLNNFFDNR